MLPADALLPEGATALEIPSDRPASVDIFKGPDVPAAATAAGRLAAVSIPDTFKIYVDPDSLDDPAEAVNYIGRFTRAYITPETAPCRAQPGPFIRRVFRTLALDLPQTFELLPSALGYGDSTVLFRTPHDREAAMGRQPFILDGATVKLVPAQMVIHSAENGIMVHIALRDYPVEQLTKEEIEDNCGSFGFVREIDPACFAGPDLSTVRVVLQLQHPREIPHELQINYTNGTTSIVPVEIVRVWDRSHSYDADGQYVPLFKPPHNGQLGMVLSSFSACGCVHWQRHKV